MSDSVSDPVPGPTGVRRPQPIRCYRPGLAWGAAAVAPLHSTRRHRHRRPQPRDAHASDLAPDDGRAGAALGGGRIAGPGADVGRLGPAVDHRRRVHQLPHRPHARRGPRPGVQRGRARRVLHEPALARDPRPRRRPAALAAGVRVAGARRSRSPGSASWRWVRALDASGSGRRTAGGCPCGTIVVLGIAAMWDFTTSGLEFGVTLAWLGGLMWVLGRWGTDDRRLTVGEAVLVGLGPLVRPDTTVYTLTVLVLVLVLRWRVESWRDRGVVLGAALALPVLYELFRMAYFASLVPNTALAKGADVSALGPRLDLPQEPGRHLPAADPPRAPARRGRPARPRRRRPPPVGARRPPGHGAGADARHRPLRRRLHPRAAPAACGRGVRRSGRRHPRPPGR